MSFADQEHQFIAMFGACCDSARLAGLAVQVELDDGRVIAGVPRQVAVTDDETEIDSTGVRARMRLAGTDIEIARIRRYTVSHPAVS